MLYSIVTVVEGDGEDFFDIPFVLNCLKGPELSQSQSHELDQLLSEFADTVFTNKPCLTSTTSFHICVTTDVPVRSSSYSIPKALEPAVKMNYLPFWI